MKWKCACGLLNMTVRQWKITTSKQIFAHAMCESMWRTRIMKDTKKNSNTAATRKREKVQQRKKNNANSSTTQTCRTKALKRVKNVVNKIFFAFFVSLLAFYFIIFWTEKRQQSEWKDVRSQMYIVNEWSGPTEKKWSAHTEPAHRQLKKAAPTNQQLTSRTCERYKDKEATNALIFTAK